MFRSLFKPKPLAIQFKPTGGRINGHLFENALTGLQRNVFWGVEVDLEDITFDSEDWPCSVSIEWITWPVRKWRELDGMSLERVTMPELVESSVYFLAQHHWIDLRHLSFRSNGPNLFEVQIAGTAHIETDTGKRTADINLMSSAVFSGVIVVADNLKIETAGEAQDAVSKHLSLDGLQQPRSEQWRYVLEPLPPTDD